MIRYLGTILLALLTSYSSLANLAVDLHIISHQSEHLSSFETNQPDLGHLVYHSSDTNSSAHQHSKQKEVTSVFSKKIQTSLCEIWSFHSFLDNLSIKLNRKEIYKNELFRGYSHYFSPPPGQFRNLPLLS